MFKAKILKKLLEPIVSRVGTLMGGALIGLGMSVSQVMAIEAAFIALVLFLIDVLISKVQRRNFFINEVTEKPEKVAKIQHLKKLAGE